MPPSHFLIKTEPSAYSISDLHRDQRTRWTGIRNYQARNYMTTSMRVGDLLLFYHSNAEPPGVAGLARVSAAAAPDATQFDAADSHYDPRATRAKPIWFCVEVEFIERARHFVPLAELRENPALAKMELVRRGSRLSVSPVSPSEFRAILAMAKMEPPATVSMVAATAKPKSKTNTKPKTNTKTTGGAP